MVMRKKPLGRSEPWFVNKICLDNKLHLPIPSGGGQALEQVQVTSSFGTLVR